MESFVVTVPEVGEVRFPEQRWNEPPKRWTEFETRYNVATRRFERIQGPGVALVRYWDNALQAYGETMVDTEGESCGER